MFLRPGYTWGDALVPYQGLLVQAWSKTEPSHPPPPVLQWLQCPSQVGIANQKYPQQQQNTFFLNETSFNLCPALMCLLCN